MGATALRNGVDYVSPVDEHIEADRLTEPARESVTFDGHTWGCPLVAFSVAVFYQRTIFAEHGLQPPRTWDELRTVCETLIGNGVVPFAMPAQDMILPLTFYNLAVNSILGTAGEAELRRGGRRLTDSNLLPAAQLMADLIPYYNDGFVAVPYAEGKALFAQGQTAMIIGGSEDYAGYLEVNPDADLGVFGFPSPDGDRQVTATGMDIIYCLSLLVVFAFRAFDLVYVLGGPTGAPGGETLVMGTSMYTTAFGGSQYGGDSSIRYAMAQGIFTSVVLGAAALSLLWYLGRKEQRVR